MKVIMRLSLFAVTTVLMIYIESQMIAELQGWLSMMWIESLSILKNSL